MIYYFLVQTVGPPVLMVIFGIDTFIHIRQRRQIFSTSSTSTINTENTERNGDKYILHMLTRQVAIYLTCSIPLLSTKIYQNIPLSIVKDDVRYAAESLLLNVAILLSLFEKIFSFCIYTLSSKYYRRELVKLFLRCRPQQTLGPPN